MTFTPESLRSQLPPIGPDATLWVGFSGGVDSSALLVALQALSLPYKLAAVHVNHGLSARAGEWQRHCEVFCQQRGIELRSFVAQVKSSGRGLEAAAREARYQHFGQILSEGDYLALAHHRDDQAETFLYRCLRGAGILGMSAMPRVRSLAAGTLLRPLLNVERRELEAWAQAQGLSWIEDDSNGDTRFDRNYLRLEVMPRLQARWPRAAEKLARAADLAAEAQELVESLALIDQRDCGWRGERLGHSLSIDVLLGLSPARRRNLLRYCLREVSGLSAGQTVLDEVESLLSSAPDAKPLLECGDFCWRRFDGRLFLTLGLQEQPNADQALQPGKMVRLVGGGQFELRRCAALSAGEGLSPRSGDWQLRWRQGGERCRPSGRRHSQSLKKLLQEYRLEPWLRDRVPLLYCDGELAAVGDLWVCEGFTNADAGDAYMPCWTY